LEKSGVGSVSLEDTVARPNIMKFVARIRCVG
jgi:hypothetical protein